jgi:hypothetical protein
MDGWMDGWDIQIRDYVKSTVRMRESTLRSRDERQS